MNKREEEKMGRQFASMSDYDKAITLVLTALGEIDQIEDSRARYDLIRAALKLYRIEMVLSFCQFTLDSHEDLEAILRVAIHDCQSRRLPTREQFGELCRQHLHWGETVQ